MRKEVKSSFLSRLMFGTQGAWESSIVPIILMASTPYFVLALWVTASEFDGSFSDFFASFFSSSSSSSSSSHPLLLFLLRLWTSTSAFGFKIIIGCFVWAVTMTTLLPGPTTRGPPTPTTGHVPVYRDNGFAYFVVTMITFVFVVVAAKTSFDATPTVIYDRWEEILASLNVFGLIFCFFLLLKGKVAPSAGESGTSGNLVFDFYWGTELYPRVFGVDVKQITNCRFGLMVWPLLALIHGIKNYEIEGKFVDSIWVSIFLQLVYVTKFFWWEGSYMRTLDIILDKAGYYICWGCIVFVPGFYVSPTLYLVKKNIELGLFPSLFLILLGLFSILVNYSADSQKEIARATKGDVKIWGKRAEVVRAEYAVPGSKTKRESLLLVSGFWGLARHLNYAAEIALALCWSLPATFLHIYPYCYVIFLTILLVHRSFRDERKCEEKYGKFWAEYRRRVPWRILPFVF